MEELLEAYPHITKEGILAALAFAAKTQISRSSRSDLIRRAEDALSPSVANRFHA